MRKLTPTMVREATARTLAARLDEFLYSHDHYGYMDALKGPATDAGSLACARTHNVEEIETKLLENDTAGVLEFLVEITDEEPYGEEEVTVSALYNQIAEHFPDPKEFSTNEEWASFLSGTLGLSHQESDLLLHDMNNLRSDEWVPVLVDEGIGDHVLDEFRGFFDIEKNEPEYDLGVD